jgi:hypothetical protein
MGAGVDIDVSSTNVFDPSITDPATGPANVTGGLK